jgi:hypothetical protein
MTTNEKKIVKEFCGQYVWLRVVYDDYCALYEKGQERIELLKEIAWDFFARLNHILVEYMELRMCTLTDPPGPKRRKNVTVQYILELIGPEASKELGLDVLSKQILAIRPFIVKGRNKAIAHLDRNALVSKALFGEYPREVLDQFWQSVQQFVDKVHQYCFGSIIGDVINNRGATDIVPALKSAVHYKDYFSQHTDLWASEVRKMRYNDA